MNDVADLAALSLEEVEALAAAADTVDAGTAEELRAMVEVMRERAAAEREAQQERLNALAMTLSRKRQEAVDARMSSGIEDEWAEDEDAYQGIDDANRDTVSTAGARVQKPSSNAVTPAPATPTRSTVFLNITRPYVDAGAARISDMLLPTDDRPWSLQATPIPDLVDVALAAQAQGTVLDEQQLSMMNKQRLDAEEDATRRAEVAQKQIEDWLTESGWHGEVRKMLDDAARIGSGVLKGPFPRKVRAVKWERGQDGSSALVVSEKIIPVTKRIDPWNFFPDAACYESIHEGSYTWERDHLTAKGLRDLVGVDGYIESEIRAAIEEGPKKVLAGLGGRNDGMSARQVRDSDQFEVWYYHGAIDRDDLLSAGMEMDEDGPDEIQAIIVMVNDRVIKAAENPLDTGVFPYDVFPWQRRTGVPWGMGIARQVRTPQRMLNAATRAMQDNAGLSSGPQIVLRKKAITPANGSYELTPRKIWFASEEADIRSVSDAIMSLAIPSMQIELMNIIQFALKMAEDVTGMPLLLQGQQGSAPATLGGQQIAINNASGVLRRIARGFDDFITEPHIRRYYTWLMQYSDNEDAKGDFSIDARGSSALVERDLQNQAVVQMGSLVMNPAYGASPKRWFEETLKAWRLDPRKFKLTEQEAAGMAQSMPQPPPPPQLEVANIRAQTDMQKAQMASQADMEEASLRASVEMQKLAAQAEEAERQRQHDASMENMRLQLKMMEFAEKRNLSLEAVKAQLAQTAMKVNAQKELTVFAANNERSAPQVATPPTEPAGRAPNGMAYAR